MKYIFFFLIINSVYSHGIEPMDNYYSDDLLDAVDQAKMKPHHYDYSNQFRYKRSTAQSIDLNRLDLDELDETRLLIEPRAQDTLTELASEKPLTPEDRHTESSGIQGTNEFPDMDQVQRIFSDITHSTPQGDYRTSDIVQMGTVMSTPRP